MKAIVYHNYGSPDVLRCADVDKPAPGENEVLIKVRAASINPLDWHSMRGQPFLLRMGNGLRKPKDTRLGVDVAGEVETAGRNVTQFHPGDAVFGVCRGALAEYAVATEDKLAPKPANVSFEEAASAPVAALTALQGLRDRGRIRPGHKVLVDGASGGVGTFAVQMAKAFGAEVTAVCSTAKLETAQALGADHVIDYTQEDFTRSGRRYDLILGANAHHSLFEYRRALAPRGIYVMAGGGVPQVFQALLLAPLLSLGSRKLSFFITRVNKADLGVLRELLESGKIKPVIDRNYTLSEAAEAVRYLEQGHARGKVVILVPHTT